MAVRRGEHARPWRRFLPILLVLLPAAPSVAALRELPAQPVAMDVFSDDPLPQGRTPTRGATPPPHPRLILDPARIIELRAESHPGGPPVAWTERQRVIHLAYRSIVRGAEALSSMSLDDPWWGSTDCPDSRAQQGGQFQGLMTLAMGHLLREGEPSYHGEFLSYTMKLLENWRQRGYPMWGGPCFCDLNTGELLAGWALAFDWLDPEMDSVQVRHSVEALSELLSRMDRGGCLELIADRLDNNHVGVAFAGRGLAALALEGHLDGAAEEERRRRLRIAAEKVGSYLDRAFPDGSGYEGVMYANYGMNLSLPFALATRRLAGHLAPDEQVLVQPGRGAMQAGTWLLYEQLPNNRYGATPLNDTELPPWDLNGPYWRSWPWLLAFAGEEAPSAVRQLFLTTYTPAEMASAVLTPFDPDGSATDFDGVLFSQAGDGSDPRFYNAVAILLGWPDPQTPAAAFLDPATLPSSKAFPARGLVLFRDGLHSLDALGRLVPEEKGTLITFECRQRAPNASGRWGGHVQFDQNQFTVFSRGEPLFWDSGYEGWPPQNGTHNTHMIQAEDGSWAGYNPGAPTEGALVRWHFGLGAAPSMAEGDDTEAWNFPYAPGSRVDRSRRYLFVLPRGSQEAPYILVHDELDYGGQRKARAQWFWHSGNASRDPDFSFDLAAGTASIALGSALAQVRILSPDSLESIRSEIVGSYGWTHRRLTVQTGPRSDADLVLAGLFTDLAPSGMRITPLPAGSPGVLAYKLVEHERTDLVVFRRGDLSGDWEVTLDGRRVSGDASHAILRMTGADPQWGDIGAGMMIEGSTIRFDGQLVMGLREGGDVVFSTRQVEVQSHSSVHPAYRIGPLVPAAAVVNGVKESVRMWDEPVPSWVSAGSQDVQVGPPTPNPAREGTTLPFYLRAPGRVRVTIYDVRGRLVRDLYSGDLEAGLNDLRWDGRTGGGDQAPRGIYLFILRAAGREEKGRIVVAG